MTMRSRYLTALAVVLILLIPTVIYVHLREDDNGGGSRTILEILDGTTEIVLRDDAVPSLYVLDTDPSRPDFPAEMERAATLTPLFVQSGPGAENVNPVIIGTKEKGVDIITGLTRRQVITVPGEEIDSRLYLHRYQRATVCFMVSSYRQALAISPVASFTGLPVFTTSDPTAPVTMRELGVTVSITVGTTRTPGGTDSVAMGESEINDLLLRLLSARGLTTDYIVVTNPGDIVDYRDRLTPGKLPVPGLSLLAAELAAHHRAPVYFGPGLPAFDQEYGDGFTQLGISREVNNEAAAEIRQQVLAGVGDLTRAGMGTFDAPRYLALVGGPVTLPMYSWDINDYQQERQYTPSDYYYGDINDDPYQELAVGRIFARSLTDASLLVLRSIAYDEISGYPYPHDASSELYGRVSEDWKENSLACMGTTKVGPFPGILTPTLVNQTRTMSEAGYLVTPMGYDLATQAAIMREFMDEMNYAVYYGHGDYDCWYTTVPDPVDADMVNGVDLKPGFAIAMACLTGMTDSLSIPLDNMIAMAFLHSGHLGYIGATRIAYGLYDYEVREDGAVRGTGALYLVDVFSEHATLGNQNVGEALRLAKNGLIATQGWEYSDENDPGYETQVTVTQYVLYGDPAHSLWVPMHHG